MVMDKETRLTLRKLFHDVKNDLMTLDGFLSLLQEEVAVITGEVQKDILLYAEKSASSSQRLNDRLNTIIDIIYRELELKVDGDIL
ncbi:MAG: hypothetical protein ACFFD4_30200 [Candidatus Odinarchaeota archaeon]